MHRDRRATLRLGGVGTIISDSILGGGHKTLLLNLYKARTI